MQEPYVVRRFGGGLNFAGHPAFIEDDEWTWSNGFMARDGVAEVMIGYTQISNGSWLPVGNTAIGIVPDAFVQSAVLCLSRPAAAETPVDVKRMASNGSTTNIPLSGTSPTASLGASANTGVLGGQQYVALGNTAGNYSLLRYDGTNFFRVAPTMVLRPQYLGVGGKHAFAGWLGTASGERRQLSISDADDGTIWDPTPTNSAELFRLDAFGEIISIIPAPNGVVVVTTQEAYYLQVTGGSPNYTVRRLDKPGSRVGGGPSAAGPIYRGPADIEVALAGTTGGKIARYLRDTNIGFFTGWHQQRDAVLFCGTTEGFYHDPRTETSWRIVFPATVGLHAIMGVAASSLFAHYMMTGAGVVYREDVFAATPAAVAGAFVDTKDFAFEDPQPDDYVDGLKVDWEPLTNATTDSIRVYGLARREVSRSLLGNVGLHQDLTAQFTLLGTLTGGADEVNGFKLRGRYTRFRFEQVSGRSRIRGFAIRRRRAADEAN